MWGGSLAFNYTDEVLAAQASAFSNFMNPKNFDPLTDMGVALVFQNPGGVYAAADELYYVKPIENPPVYQEFLSIPSVGSSVGITNVSSLVIGANGVLPSNARR